MLQAIAIVNGLQNNAVPKQLRGVNHSGSEFCCVNNLGIFEGPVDDAAVKTMKKWNINVVRVPLNEDCWLGINGHTPAYSGDNYRKAVIQYVNTLRNNDLSVILDLHWSDGYFNGVCAAYTAKCQKPMPDAQNAPNFWSSVASQFKGDNKIIFDLFNEPFPNMFYSDANAAWACWRDGRNACSKLPYIAVGMQELVNVVRGTGSSNPIMLGGIDYSSDLWKWKEYVPKDPLNKIVASWHAYALNRCNTTSCWEGMIGPINKEYPVIVGEIGETDCTHRYIDQLMPWLDGKGISYLGWTWNTWGCRDGPALIKDYAGTPTNFGVGLQQHLLTFVVDDTLFEYEYCLC